jgi:two-component system response regulator NreC
MTEPIKVLLADDHPVVLEGLRQVLAAEPDMKLVGVAVNGQDALEKCRKWVPDVVLLDLTMPELNGLETTRLITEGLSQIRVVVFSMHDQAAFVQQALRAGARGYVLKGSPVKEVTRAIREVHNGAYFLCPSIQGGVIDNLLKGQEERPADQLYDHLTDREQQVFRLLVEGNSTTRISDLLFVSPKTVEKHRVNVLRKLGVSNLVELVKYAVRIGVVDPGQWKE